jgi:hypothetical protein
MAVRGKKKAKDDPSYRNLKAEYYPVQRQVNLGSSGNSTRMIVDVGRVLSTVNHRLYRQGKTYQVKIDLDNRPDAAAGAAQFDVYALADTWYVQKAWQLARATYLRATADEREKMSSQQIARWEDFRVNAGVSTGAVNVVPYQYSETLAGALNTDGEFDASEITLADGTTQRTFTWGSTPSASEYSILQEYDKSGDTDLAPSTSSATKAYSDSDDRVDESQMDDLASKGNAPPYNATSFTDNVWVKIATLDNSVAGVNPGAGGAHSRMSTGYFNAPCGLVVLVPSLSGSLAGNVTLTAKSGQYKGVAAMNMGA